MILVQDQLCTIDNLSLNGNKANNATASNGIKVIDQKFWLHDLWITECKSAGILIDGTGGQPANYGKISDTFVGLCGGNGLTILDNADSNEISNVWAGDNGGHGIEIQSDGCRIVQCHCWGSDSTNDGIRITAATRAQIIGCHCQINGGAGIRATGGSSGMIISGCVLKANGTQGAYLFNADKGSFTGNVVYNNASTGLRLDTADDWTITGNLFYDDQGGKTQDYAIDDNGSTSTGHVIVGNQLKAADHQTGNINLLSSTRIVKNNNDATDWPVVERVIEILVTDPSAVVTTGDGKAYIGISDDLNGLNLIDADAFLTSASSSGGPTTISVFNQTDGVDMLSTAITIDDLEASSYTAAVPPVINAATDDVATGDIIRIDVDVAGIGSGLIVVLTFGL